MDRRDFLKAGAVVAAGAAVSGLAGTRAFAAGHPAKPRKGRVYSSETGEATADDILVRFLGTGAADWKGRDDRGELRRNCSILVDSKILVDLTQTVAGMLPEGFIPEAIFYTHSHNDHYNPSAALKAGVKKVYMSDTWYERCRWEFKNAAAKLGLPMPEFFPLAIGQKVEVEGLSFTALPANHAAEYEDEQTLIYLIEKGPVRILYATDTGGIVARAARLAGIDGHVKDGQPITGLIMEATMGMDHDSDYRMFTHSSVGTVMRTTDAILRKGRLTAPEGQPVYLTHMARTLHGTQADLDANLPEPLRAAYDGLEVIFRRP
ncbi:MAG: twin-arginine translocation signal domain-containing protein [Bacteroidales bacterium]|nr:twin-arginine translocation signal domain-containing protein [Candidatus Cryptobacteroides equifaecalis]